jgi:2-keto-4-pentenoate hydratase/2-oxohepta-3-ene-1,7-dioic acid hydratase in catechol pathway
LPAASQAEADPSHPIQLRSFRLKIAAFQFKNAPTAGRRVGLVSADAQTITPFDLNPDQAQRGAQVIVEAAAAGAPIPSLTDERIPLSDVQLHAPLPLPRRNVWCVGRNYHAHAKELAGSVFKSAPTDVQSWPIVFTKVPETVVGPFEDVHLPDPSISTQIDYEAELALVIGLGGKNIGRDEAMKHVFGYTIVNDVTARDVQMRHQQWDMGKSFDTFCPMGPWIVTSEEVDGSNLDVKCWVNGEVRQDANTRDLIFDIPSLIETVSRGITLYPGDVIATGTAAGVGMGMTPQRWLTSGDSVRIEIQGIGMIENRIV